MKNSVYMGPLNGFGWYPAPASGMGRTRVGWSSEGTYLNGGGFSNRSVGKHARFEMSWPFLRHAEIQRLLALFDSPGPIYFLDPFAASTNALTPPWASPYLMSYDAPSALATRPVAVSTPSNVLSLPVQGAQFTVNPATAKNPITIPGPDGYEFQFGWIGTATGTAVVQVDGVAVAPLPAGGSATVNTTTVSSGGLHTVTFAGTGTLTIYGMTARVVPLGTPYPTGGFVSGAGVDRLDVVGDVSTVGYSAPEAINYQSLTCSLKEVGPWM